MTDRLSRQRKRTIISCLVGIVISSIFLALLIAQERSDALPTNDWCEQHYARARNAADSTAVDNMLDMPNPGNIGNLNARYCGDFRLALQRARKERAPLRRMP